MHFYMYIFYYLYKKVFISLFFNIFVMITLNLNIYSIPNHAQRDSKLVS